MATHTALAPRAATLPRRLAGAGIRTARTALLALSATTAVYLLAVAGGVPLAVDMMPGYPAVQLPLAMVVSTSVMAAIAGSIALAVTKRIAGSRSTVAFRALAAVVLLLSLGAPLALGADVATKVALSVMHVVAAITIVAALERKAA